MDVHICRIIYGTLHVLCTIGRNAYHFDAFKDEAAREQQQA